MTLLRVATPDEGAVSGPGDDAVTASFLIRLSVDLERARLVIAVARRQHGMYGKGHGVGSTGRDPAL